MDELERKTRKEEGKESLIKSGSDRDSCSFSLLSLCRST